MVRQNRGIIFELKISATIVNDKCFAEIMTSEVVTFTRHCGRGAISQVSAAQPRDGWYVFEYTGLLLVSCACTSSLVGLGC